MDDHSSDELHVIVALAERSMRSLAHDSERFRKKCIDRLAFRQPLLEFSSLITKLIV